jgi:hypothetical protein
MSKESLSQSQSISGSSITNSTINQSQAAGKSTISVSQSTQSMSMGEALTVDRITDLLTQIENLIRAANLPNSERTKALKYLDAAKEEVKEEEPKRDLVSGNLERMAKSIKTADETMKAGKNLWDSINPLLLPLASWLGINTVKGWLGLP